MVVVTGANNTIGVVSTTDPKPISWQSAFWGLFALAVNAMSQPSSRDWSTRPRMLYPARSSPIVCAADTVEVLVVFIGYIIMARASIREAAGYACWWRGPQFGLVDNEVQRNPPVATAAEAHPWGRAVVLLGVLMQAVKLFGVRGIPWTQTWAGIYVLSYLVHLALGKLAPRDWRDHRPPVRMRLGLLRASMALWVCACLAQTGIFAWVFLEVAHPERINWDIGRSVWMIAITFLPLSFPMGTLLDFSVYTIARVLPSRLRRKFHFGDPTAWPRVYAFGFSTFAVMSLPPMVHLILKNDYPERSLLVDVLTTNYLLLCCISFAYSSGLILRIIPWLPLPHTGAPQFLPWLVSRWGDWTEADVLPYFVPLIPAGVLLLSLLYYGICFDPTGTSKPAWTENLG